jgi:serine-type D-Ala-D-Ala carboxypeptidase (penicillin-binding protein 5/6)
VGFVRPPFVVAVFVVIAVCLCALGSPGALIAAPDHVRQVLVVLAPEQVVPGRRPTFLWPTIGEAAVAVAGIGLVGASPKQRRVPVASLTKMMTALVVLSDHPLALGRAGSSVTIKESDVRNWEQEARAGDSVVEVRTGEALTEHQLLAALLIPSGDNIADLLATWDAGSVAAFVAKMNRMAATFGLNSTHYADPSGVDPRSASTASDQALVASKLMADPVAAGIVGRRRINLPVVGVLTNHSPALGIDGIVGVKGGYSSHAHHCLVTAAFRAHHAAVVISVALGQPDRDAPARIDEALLEAATQPLQRSRLTVPGGAVGVLNVLTGGPNVGLVAPDRPPMAVLWPGLRLVYTIAVNPTEDIRSARPGSVVGVLTVSAAWGALASVPVRVAATPRTGPSPPDERPSPQTG